MPSRFATMLCVAGLGLGIGSQARAQVVVSIDGDVATAQIALQSGDETYEATLILRFDQPENLSSACLGVSADVLDVVEAAAIDARLPDPSRYEIDPEFPVRVTVSPPPGCGLSFRNEVVIELTTAELEHVPFSPYRLMKGPADAPFADITEAVESGSVRARGRGGRFSEIVLVEDLSQTYGVDADALLDQLDDELDDEDIAITARTTLDADLALVSAARAAGDFGAALDALDTFESDLRGFAGAAVPNQWRSSNDLVDELGEMLGLVGALRFQLSRLQGVP